MDNKRRYAHSERELRRTDARDSMGNASVSCRAINRAQTGGIRRMPPRKKDIIKTKHPTWNRDMFRIFLVLSFLNLR